MPDTICYLAAMGGDSPTLISPEEYLSMSFGDREPEYVRGQLIYRPMPDYAHAFIQMMLGSMLIQALSAPGLYRTRRPLLAPGAGQLPLSGHRRLRSRTTRGASSFGAPHIAIEIISKDESHSEMLQKLEDYQTWGVANTWTVDPRRKNCPYSLTIL